MNYAWTKEELKERLAQQKPKPTSAQREIHKRMMNRAEKAQETRKHNQELAAWPSLGLHIFVEDEGWDDAELVIRPTNLVLRYNSIEGVLTQTNGIWTGRILHKKEDIGVIRLKYWVDSEEEGLQGFLSYTAEEPQFFRACDVGHQFPLTLIPERFRQGLDLGNRIEP
jgi:hypothetical protein